MFTPPPNFQNFSNLEIDDPSPSSAMAKRSAADASESVNVKEIPVRLIDEIDMEKFSVKQRGKKDDVPFFYASYDHSQLVINLTPKKWLRIPFAIENAYQRWEPIEIPVGVDKPLEHLAWRVFQGTTYNYEKARKGCGDPTVERLLKMVKEYQIDGLVMHATISCRATTVGQIFLQNMINEHIKIPCLFLTSDIIDLRNYSEAEWRMQIDNFMETIRTRKSSH